MHCSLRSQGPMLDADKLVAILTAYVQTNQHPGSSQMHLV